MTIPDEAVQAAVTAMNTNDMVSYDSLKARQSADAKRIITAALPFLQGVKVKKLEWREDKLQDGRKKWLSSEEVITETHPSWENQGFHLFHAAKTFDTVDEAKAAAQADYEARILSAIKTSATHIGKPINDKSRLDNTARNLILNRTHTDLENIINGHDPEVGNLNNDIWDRLDKMALEIEAISAPSPRAQALEETTDLQLPDSSCDLVFEIKETSPLSQKLARALRELLHAVCGETGFANSVRQESGHAYPWPALDIAEDSAIRALSSQPVADGLPQDVINLVIAAREAFDTGVIPDDEEHNLDKALEPFSERVLYENEPEEDANDVSPSSGCVFRDMSVERPVADGWLPIETAPRDGTEVLAWRYDCGPFIASFTSCSAFPLTQAEIDELDEDTLFKGDWFTQWPQALRLEGSEEPTHWRPLPASPGASDTRPTGGSDEH